MKQRCPPCESWSAEGVERCACGHQFDVRRGGVVEDQPAATFGTT